MSSKRTNRSVALDSRAALPVAEPFGLKALAGGGFLLLALAVCVRPLFQEGAVIAVPELLAPPQQWWLSNPTIMHVSHLLAGAGLALAGAWVAISRRAWRFSGLEIGAGLLVVAALLSVPGASDKRMAINAAIGTILPLAIAAMLHQLLAGRRAWQQALLAALLAIGAANAWKSTAQHFWEADEALRRYQESKDAFWAQMGRSADDPVARIYEERIKARQPSGQFFHPNVMASFLLLGVAGCAAAAIAWWPRRRRDPQGPQTPAWTVLLLAGLVAAAAWLVLVISWVGSAGAIAGLVTMIGAALASQWLRNRPPGLAIVLAGGLLLLQATLIVLALNAGKLYHSLEAQGGKVKSMAVRLNYWEGALQLFVRDPLTGGGPAQFGKHYTSLKAPYAAEDLSHPHDWLLSLAADWGILGPIALLIALALPGWRVIRSLSTAPPEGSDRVNTSSLLPAGLVVLACWLLVGLGAWDISLTGAAVASLITLALAGLWQRSSRLSQIILLAGLVGFFVHAMVEMSGGVPGATWPFWAILALALTWAVPSPQEPIATATPPPALRPALLLPLAAAIAIVVLAAPPLRATALIDQAQQAVHSDPDRAVTLLREAAEADPRDPVPLKAAALLRQKMGRQAPARAPRYQREAVEMFRAATQRDPDGYMVWRNLALAEMYVAVQTGDFSAVRQAVADMQEALALYPNWPKGWLELAGMAGIQSDAHPDQPDLLRIAIDAVDKAQSLDDLWPADDPRKFKLQERSRLQQMRQEFTGRLQATESKKPRP